VGIFYHPVPTRGEILLKTSQTRRWRCVGVASVTHPRRVGDTSSMNRRRVVGASASRRRRVHDASVTRRRRIGVVLASRRQRVGVASAPRRCATCLIDWTAKLGNDVEDKPSNGACKARRWRCVGDATVSRWRRVGVESVTRQQRVGVISARVGIASTRDELL
jgi:hypothetical protein